MRAANGVWSCAIVLALATTAWCDGGPAAGSDVPELKVEAVAGADTGTKDFAAERDDRPTIYYFVQHENWDRPVGRLLATLDEALSKDRSEVQIVTVFLTDEVGKARDYLPRGQQSLRLRQTVWSVYDGPKTGPADWNIDVRSNVTVVVAADRKVTGSFAYGSVNETLAREILAKLPAKE
jgi:hypothetical protein